MLSRRLFMPLPSRNISAGRPVVLDTALLPLPFLPWSEKVAVNFKNAGNGGLFNVFEVPQMENEWTLEDGKCTPHGPPQVYP